MGLRQRLIFCSFVVVDLLALHVVVVVAVVAVVAVAIVAVDGVGVPLAMVFVEDKLQRVVMAAKAVAVAAAAHSIQEVCNFLQCPQVFFGQFHYQCSYQ
jgi:hypothetical protein